MMKGAKIKRSIYETPIAYSSKRNKICFWVDETIGKDGTNYGCEVEFANADKVANDWAVVETEQDGDGDNMDKKEIEVWLKDIAKIKPQFVPETVEPSEWFDKAQKKQRNQQRESRSHSKAVKLSHTAKANGMITLMTVRL